MYRCNIYFIDASMLICPSKLNYILILFVDICTKNPQESASMYLHTFQMSAYTYVCVFVINHYTADNVHTSSNSLQRFYSCIGEAV